ncbi:cytosolic phospholipase A2 gamma-like [Onychostoma macrolepis]|uniref:cytosolic phospholipase A2 gamma-like n=1 Tax=Onychostoma macrolepis TaxID=369639 RepID=UPI00272AFECF|nr:cytosolic phospholipase A2 gamma-like [Onychostoma macrolepis]
MFSGTVRFKPLLNGSEQEFVASRRNTVLQTLKKLQIQCSRREVPNIALLGSGGGQRAMVGLLGSLVQLEKAGLLDCILYLSGVSGSTWCMASLYKEPDWSTKLETVKDKIIERISGPGVSWEDALAKLKKYYYGKDFFSLTDVWAVMTVTSRVKEIDEHTLTEQRNKNNKDPFPIYTVVDKQCKQCSDGGLHAGADLTNKRDQWFEINPYEAGYSLTGAFVDTSSFGSQFHKGSKKKHQDEFDMLYLQALCGSALGDGKQNKEEILKQMQDFFKRKDTILEAMRKEQPEREYEEVNKEMESDSFHCGFASDDVPISPPVDECYQVLMDLVDMNLTVLKGKDTSHLDESIRKNLNDLSGGTNHSICSMKKEVETTDRVEKPDIMSFTMDVCNNLKGRIKFWLFEAWIAMLECVTQWIWGRKYNFLHNMTDGAVPPALLESETRDYIDAGLSNNSPYFSVLRKERDIDLIISLDFSAGDPFMTVKDAADTCKKLNIPFPKVDTSHENEDKPKDFYVFRGKNAPTVIHIPLFNVVNCGDEVKTLREKYRTFKRSYSAEMITDLMEVAGKNISNNKKKLLEEIRVAVGKKGSSRFNPHLSFSNPK